MKKKRLLSLAMAAILTINAIAAIPVAAAFVSEEKATYELSYELSKTDVKPGDTVKVTVGLSNYENVNLGEIMGLQINVDIDKTILDYVPNSVADVTTDKNSGDLFMAGAPSSGVKYMYASMNSEKKPLSRNNKNLFEFSVTAKSNITIDKQVCLKVSAFSIKDKSGHQITTKVTNSPVINILTEKPVIKLNDALPIATEYDNNVAITFNKGTASIKKDGGESTEIKSGYIADKNGNYEVTVTDAVGNIKKETFTIVLGVSSIEIKTKPTVLSYTEGTKLNPAGGIIEVTYINNSKSEIALTADMCNPSDVGNNLGTKNIAVTYLGKKTSFNIEVVEKALISISMKTNPKTNYIEGQDLDLTNGKITLTYNNGTTEDKDITLDMLSGYNKNKIGNQNITVSYNNKTTNLAVTVVAKSILSIEVTTQPTNKSYIEGQTFDKTGMIITARYDNGTSAIITAYTVSSAALTKGQTSVEVSYLSKTATVSGLTVREKKPQAIAITKNPNTTYKTGGIFSANGGELTVTYDNGTSETISLTDAMCSVPDMDTIGEKTITVSYTKNGVTKTTDFKITVQDKVLDSISIKTQPSIKTFIEGNAFVTDGVITLHYDNNTTEDKNITSGMCSGYNMNSVGTQTVTITEDKKTTNYQITVNAKSVVSIDMKSNPDKTSYIEGQDLVLSGAKITVKYDNETQSYFEITTAMISGYNKNATGMQDVTVTFEGKTTSFAVSVRAKIITNIVITKQPDKVSYIEGQSFDKTGMVITANYDNGTSETITNYTLNKTVLSTTDKAIIVSYLDKTVTITGISVREKQLSSIALSKNPTKMSYIEGQNLDMTAAEITLTYDNGEMEVKSVTNNMITGFNKDILGEQTLTITEGSKTTTVKIMVKAKTATSITLKTAPKSNYIEGQPLVLTGGIINVVYDNETNADINMTDDEITISGYDKDKVGTQDITVTYQGQKTAFSITVVAKAVQSISIKNNPIKIEYLAGQDFIVDGGIINVLYDNSTNKDIDITSEMISGYQKDKIAEQTITVTLNKKTATFKITVISRENVDKLINDINNLKIDKLTVDDKDVVNVLKATYASMKQVEKEAITNKAKLDEMSAKINDLLYPAFEQKYEKEKIVVSAPTGVLPNDAFFNIEIKEPDKDMQAKLKSEFGIGSEFVTLLDITLKDSSGKLIQPNKENGKVKVSIKLENKYKDLKNLTFVYIDESGNFIKIDAQIIEGYAVFETDHFSKYALIEINDSIENPIDKEDKNPNTGDSSAILLYLVSLAISSGAILVLYKKRKSIV